MSSFSVLFFGVTGIFFITLINPFYALPIFIFGHFVEPVQFFRDLKQFNPSLLLGFAVLGAWFLHVVFTGNFIAAKNKQVAVVVLFILWSFICTAVGFYGDFTYQLLFMRNAIPFFIFLYMIKTRRQVVVIVWVFLIMATISVIYGLYCLKANIGIRDRGIVRVTSFMANPNAFGATLALLIPICISLIMSSYEKIYKFILIGIMFLLITGVVISYSRTSMIAMLVSLFFTPVLFCTGKKKITAFIATLLLLPTLYYFFPLDRVKWRAHNRLAAVFEAESVAEVDLGRVETTRAGYMMMLRNPLFGVGLGGFGHEYHDLAQSSDDLELVMSRYGERGLSAHNLYVQVGGQLGITGLILYLYLILLSFKNLIKAEKQFLEADDDILYSISRSIKIFLIVFLVAGVSTSGLENKLFWIFAALAIVLNRLSNEQLENEPVAAVA